MKAHFLLFLGTFTTLLAVINPLEALSVFLKLVQDMDEPTRRREQLGEPQAQDDGQQDRQVRDGVHWIDQEECWALPPTAEPRALRESFRALVVREVLLRRRHGDHRRD